jgi:hypothetical protein
MTLSSNDRRQQKYAPIFDVDAVTGVSIEVFYADRTLETFGRGGAGSFWWPRRRGFAPEARGPFPTDYSAYRHAATSAALSGECSVAQTSVQVDALCKKNVVMLPYCFHRCCAWKQRAFERQKSYFVQTVAGAPGTIRTSDPQIRSLNSGLFDGTSGCVAILLPSQQATD